MGSNEYEKRPFFTKLHIDRASLVAQMLKFTCQCRRHRFDPWVGKIPHRRKWQPLQSSCLRKPLSRWCHPTISSSVTLFSSCLQSFPASRSFPMGRLISSGSQNIGASASVLPMNIQDWFLLGLTGLISLLSKGLSRVLSSTTVKKH